MIVSLKRKFHILFIICIAYIPQSIVHVQKLVEGDIFIFFPMLCKMFN